jgi:hypothetical protein
VGSKCGAFYVGDQILRLEIEDIYFLTGFSNREVAIVLVEGWRESTNLLDQYIVQYLRDGAHIYEMVHIRVVTSCLYRM